MLPPSETRPAVYVVIIDDSADDLALFQWHLKRSGLELEIIPFNSSEAACDFFQRFSGSGFPWPAHSTIFCDVKMTGFSGFDILKQVRSCPAFTTTPMYMMSGANEPTDRKQLLQLGATGYLAKFPTAYELRSILTANVSDPPPKPVA